MATRYLYRALSSRDATRSDFSPQQSTSQSQPEASARNAAQSTSLPESNPDIIDENEIFTEFQTEYIEAGEVHGSGCTLSAAIAAALGKVDAEPDAKITSRSAGP